MRVARAATAVVAAALAVSACGASTPSAESAPSADTVVPGGPAAGALPPAPAGATAGDARPSGSGAAAPQAPKAFPDSVKAKISSVLPADASTVGVAHPLVVRFDRQVQDRHAAQQALRVVTDPPVRGAWYWIDDQEIHYRPAAFWPAGTKVTLSAPGRTTRFEVGRRQVLLVELKKHRLQVVRDGRVVRRFQISAGKPGWETRGGTKVIMEKIRGKEWTNEQIDAAEEYDYHSDYAMRMTNSGEFLHDAPWNTGNIGEVNASHGCVGLMPNAMKWLFEHTLVGDAVIVRGSPKPYRNLINRYADWNIPWATWERGDAG